MKYDNFKIEDDDLPECLNRFFNYSETIRGKSNTTISGYKNDLTMFFRFMKLHKNIVSKKYDFEKIKINDIDDTFLNNIKLNDLYAFISFTEKYKSNGNCARARKVASLKSFFKYLHDKIKIIDENPTLELESPKIEKRNPVYLSLDESKSLLNAIDGKYKERDYCIMTLFLNCGLRLSELCGIDISRIKDDILTVIGKGNKERTIYLNDACLKALESYLKIRNKDINKIIDKDALFLSKNYKRIGKRSIELMLKKYLAKANLDTNKYTPHKLRHTAATLMYKYGNVDIRSLQEILGHANVSTTQIYTHVDDEQLRKATNSNPLNMIG